MIHFTPTSRSTHVSPLLLLSFLLFSSTLLLYSNTHSLFTSPHPSLSPLSIHSIPFYLSFTLHFLFLYTSFLLLNYSSHLSPISFHFTLFIIPFTPTLLLHSLPFPTSFSFFSPTLFIFSTRHFILLSSFHSTIPFTFSFSHPLHILSSFQLYIFTFPHFYHFSSLLLSTPSFITAIYSTTHPHSLFHSSSPTPLPTSYSTTHFLLPHSLTPSLPHSLTPSLPHSLTPSLPFPFLSFSLLYSTTNSSISLYFHSLLQLQNSNIQLIFSHTPLFYSITSFNFLFPIPDIYFFLNFTLSLLPFFSTLLHYPYTSELPNFLISLHSHSHPIFLTLSLLLPRLFTSTHQLSTTHLHIPFLSLTILHHLLSHSFPLLHPLYITPTHFFTPSLSLF
ncbi:hypothetical protein HG535_0C00100 [Zygotorulaspora mrakii]|uniref:Uncharacterized protein n=1 Tax=Zygotorulaspora mrakii TaxID=42260 RepID=A0A7H9AZE7_ZYGMR|nr:uncharacterized protein HG535_0A09230 [Zygotorulaspora mrakii]XP_037143391.1 uncharacterized protein HG535_0C00100 [Zygotorulaspora mrakii]QLG70972.1 hypothetical protein HG535_0A09230 [Zygotorulaspora mrakii]QLG71663.1 hypothetical protein HG535_0C00100 [Zygotorulaspora mrakii]